jgi:hypothetical protein
MKKLKVQLGLRRITIVVFLFPVWLHEFRPLIPFPSHLNVQMQTDGLGSVLDLDVFLT